jgi:hypothetical protein
VLDFNQKSGTLTTQQLRTLEQFGETNYVKLSKHNPE